MRCLPRNVLWMLALVSGACGDDEAGPRAGLDAASGDGGSVLGVEDASTPAPVSMDASLAPATPDAGAFPSGGPACDPRKQLCADPHAPLQLDCASLPANGTCRGGPREVLLLTKPDGLVAMLDPSDGHFLGYLKTASQRVGSADYGYVQVTQGPDQCLWSLSRDDSSDTQRAVERWNTDGSFRDDVIPRGKHLVGGTDRLGGKSALAFGREHVYVAARGQVVRFGLDGRFVDVIVPDARVSSLLVLGDGSLLTAGASVQHWPASGAPPRTVLDEATGQLAYAGGGALLTPGHTDRTLYRVAIETGVTEKLTTSQLGNVIPGMALLGNGRWLFTGGAGGVRTIDPVTQQPPTGEPIVWEEKKLLLSGPWQQVGRACLPAEVVERKPVREPPVTGCAAPDGPALLEESFESGAFTGSGTNRSYRGFTEQTPLSPLTELDEAVAAHGMRSLRVHPKQGEPRYNTGVARTLDKLRPSYIGFQVRFGALEGGWADLLLVGDNGEDLTTLSLDPDGLSAAGSVIAGTVDADTWVRVQLRDIDWDARTYDLYVDCQRRGDDVPFQPESGSSLAAVGMYVGAGSGNMRPAYFDEIVIK